MESGFLRISLELLDKALQVSILVLMESGFLPVLTIGIAFATIIAHVFIF